MNLKKIKNFRFYGEFDIMFHLWETILKFVMSAF